MGKKIKILFCILLVTIASAGFLLLRKSGQKQTQNNSEVVKYVDVKFEKPTIHVFDDNKFVFVAQKDGFGGIAFGQDYISVFDVHQKQINISRDKEQIVSPKMVKDEYFNIISYDLNAAGFPSKKTEVYKLLGEKEYRGSHVINQYYADNKDYIPVTLYKVTGI